MGIFMTMIHFLNISSSFVDNVCPFFFLSLSLLQTLIVMKGMSCIFFLKTFKWIEIMLFPFESNMHNLKYFRYTTAMFTIEDNSRLCVNHKMLVSADRNLMSFLKNWGGKKKKKKNILAHIQN